MQISGATGMASSLQKAKHDLEGMALAMETEISSAARAFEGLAGQTDSILQATSTIVSCVGDEKVSSVLQNVQALGAATKKSIGNRLQATTDILEAVALGVALLRQLSQLTIGQEAIALETKALSVLTNVEAARLGAVGAGFQYLARELADFSRVLTENTQEVAAQTDARRSAIEETRILLLAELPALREKLARVEAALENDLSLLDAGLRQLSSTPVRFTESVQHTAQQIAGVVSAVQAHDITRQQIEHVLEALSIITLGMDDAGKSGFGAGRDIPQMHAGLSIQIYQLKTIKETVRGWTSQIKTCMQGILNVSATEVVGIGPLVLAQEREVASQLVHIEVLERESQSYGQRIQRVLGGLSNLMQLVNEHREKTKSARGRLRLLSFNSIIEARRLGAEAGAILAIAKSIKEISADWSEIVDQSARVTEKIGKLENQTAEVMQAFSEAGNEAMREAPAQTVSGLGALRSAAEFAANQAQGMNATTELMQARSADVGDIGERLETCFSRVDAVVAEIESIRDGLENDYPNVRRQYDQAEIERLFSRAYTTEVEREVMRAALRGAPLPAAQQTLGGNSVEFF